MLLGQNMLDYFKYVRVNKKMLIQKYELQGEFSINANIEKPIYQRSVRKK